MNSMKQSIKMMPAWLFVYKNEVGVTQQDTVSYTPPAPAPVPPSTKVEKPVAKQAVAPEKKKAAVPVAAKPVAAKNVAPPASKPASVSKANAAKALQKAAPVMQTQPPAQAAAQKPNTGDASMNICTIAGNTYLIKVVTLYRSLEVRSNDFKLYVCCTDELAYRSLCKLKLAKCVLVMLSELQDPSLDSLRATRSQSEFCWTLKSFFMMHLLKKSGLKSVLYCDSDVCFFADPKLLFADWGQSSIYLCTQRDLGWVEEKYGKYQAGVIGFKNDSVGIAALDWWRERCREWCSAYPDPSAGRWGDQKYLDEMPGRFGSAKISTHRGIDAAPWNTVYNNNYKIDASGGRVTIDGDPLVAYHFACLDMFNTKQFDLWHLAKIDIEHQIKSLIYLPYLNELRRSAAIVRTSIGTDLKPYLSPKSFSEAKTTYFFPDRGLELFDWDGKFGFCTISSRAYVAKTLALYTSLSRHLKNFQLWICCMDEFSHSIFSQFKLEHVTLLRVSEVETPAIVLTRTSKTLAEYCWTMKPALCTYIFEHFNTDRLLYCDSDVYFFSHPQAVYDTWQGYSTLINRQLGTKPLEDTHGMFQAGMIGFTRTPESFEVLKWWLERCTEWCYDDHRNHDRWGDQKYLDQIPNRFVSIKINDRQGIVAAPWNLVMNNKDGLSVGQSGGDVYIGNEKLIAYHFGSLNILGEDSFDLWKLEPLAFMKDVIDRIYVPYLKNIRTILRDIRAKGFNIQLMYTDAQTTYNSLNLGYSQGDIYEQSQYA